MTNWTWTKAKTRVVGRPWWKILGVRTTKLPGTNRRLRIFYFGPWTLAFIEGYVPSEAEEAAMRIRARIDAWWAAESEYAKEEDAFIADQLWIAEQEAQMGYPYELPDEGAVRADVGDGPKDYDPRRFPAG